MSMIMNINRWLFILLIVNRISGSSYNQPKFSPCATWNPNATTFADSSIASSLPWGVFVNTNNTVYVLNKNNGKLIIWLQENMNISKTISGNWYQPFAIFVTLNGDMYVDNGRLNNRVEMWTFNSTSSIASIYVPGACYGLLIDLYDNLYCSLNEYAKVIKETLINGSNTTTVVAGNGINGSTSAMLNNPRGIFLDNSSNLYVADCGNNRVQFLLFGQLNATTVPVTTTLNCPTGIVLDGNGYLFITDYGNNRIIGSDQNGFRCIAACTGGYSTASDQLYYPRGLSFDSYGNIYVVDGYNNRIQKFLLQTNRCEEITTTNILQSTAISTFHQIVQQPTGSFVPPTCPNTSSIGHNCSISNAPCDVLKPCQNNGICHNNDTLPYGYVCLCLPGFNGTQCELDYRPCKPNTCWNDGICNETSNATFYCLCKPGWEGEHCERKINYCWNVTCQNNGVCRPLFMNYTCECLGNSYSGRYCEITNSGTVIHQMVSKSFGYIAILALIIVAAFIVVMDILKYCFGIDPVYEERERIRRKKLGIKHKPVIQRFVYVDAPSQPPLL